MFPGILFLLPLFVIFVNIERTIGITLYGTYARADHHLPDVLAAVLDLDARRLLQLDPARARARRRWSTGRRRSARCSASSSPSACRASRRSAIYAFITAWGEVLFASVLTTDSTRTLAIGLRNYSSQTNVYWNQLMAAAIVVGAPWSSRSSSSAVDRARADRRRGEVWRPTPRAPARGAASAA